MSISRLKTNVLISIEEPISRTVVSKLIEDSGYRITNAESIEQIPKLITEQFYELLFIDFDSNDVTKHISFLKKIRTIESINCRRPIYIVAIQPEAVLIENNNIINHTDSILSKPIDKEDLRKILDSIENDFPNLTRRR